MEATIKTPKAPDPMQTAQAQAGMNRDTALTQAALNMTNQVTPYGNLTYKQTGTSSFVDSNGKTVTTPTYTATQTLSPAQQKILEQTDAAELNLSGLANQQSGFLKDYLAKPFEFNNDDASNWAYDLASQRILPQQAKNADALRSQLIASGIRPGTDAWDAEQERLTNANTDQLNQLALTGRNQAFNEALTTRNQPINEIGSLLSGSQIQNPNYVNTPQSQVGGVDYTGLVRDKYNAEVQQSNAAMGGLFGLGAGIIKAIPWSDRRLKRDISLIGKKKGLPWYSFRYVWSDAPHEGFMADDVVKVYPQHVHKDGDYFRVDYDAILEAA